MCRNEGGKGHFSPASSQSPPTVAISVKTECSVMVWCRFSTALSWLDAVAIPLPSLYTRNSQSQLVPFHKPQNEANHDRETWPRQGLIATEGFLCKWGIRCGRHTLLKYGTCYTSDICNAGYGGSLQSAALWSFNHFYFVRAMQSVPPHHKNYWQCNTGQVSPHRPVLCPVLPGLCVVPSL